MQTEINEVEINGVKYVKKGTVQPAELSSAYIVRSTNAGVFFGEIADKNLKEGWVKMTNARRVWYWDGAATLSQLATSGTSKPENCKFPEAVAEVTLLGVCEIIPCTNNAVKILAAIKTWKQ